MINLNGSNYQYLEQISMIPKMFEPLKFNCNPISALKDVPGTGIVSDTEVISNENHIYFCGETRKILKLIFGWKMRLCSYLEIRHIFHSKRVFFSYFFMKTYVIGAH